MKKSKIMILSAIVGALIVGSFAVSISAEKVTTKNDTTVNSCIEKTSKPAPTKTPVEYTVDKNVDAKTLVGNRYFTTTLGENGGTDDGFPWTYSGFNTPCWYEWIEFVNESQFKVKYFDGWNSTDSGTYSLYNDKDGYTYVKLNFNKRPGYHYSDYMSKNTEILGIRTDNGAYNIQLHKDWENKNPLDYYAVEK